MPRMNISVPDALRERMDEHDDINWSAVAQAAFELEIKSKIKGYGDMEKVIERLRASKQRIEIEEKPTWIGYGADFGAETAEYDELERISSIDASRVPLDSQHAPGWELLEAMTKAKIQDQASSSDLTDFLEVLTGDGYVGISRQKVEWILEGIKGVWREVKDKI